MRTITTLKLKRNRDGTWSASSRFFGRALVAEGRTMGAAMRNVIVLAQERLAAIQKENARVH